jgi:hypothetical protein
MASGTYNEGAYQLRNGGAVNFASGTIKIMIVSSAYTFDKDHASMTTPAASEISVTGYTPGFASADRKTLAGKTITKDTTNDRVKYDADDPSSWTLAAGATVGGEVVYWHDTDDATSVPLFFLDHADVPTNGGTFTVQFHADGIGYIQQ